jgi:hypothetical protein
MSILLENDLERSDAIYYHFNESEGKWEKSSRSVFGNTADKHSGFNEYYEWNKDKGRFDLSSRNDQRAIYNSNNKITEFRTLACEYCSSTDPKETNTTNKYFYDQNDSLSVEEYWTNIPSPTLLGKDIYTYQSQGTRLFVSVTKYDSGGNSFLLGTYRYDSGRLVLNLGYSYPNGQKRLSSRDSFAYNPSGFRIYEEEGFYNINNIYVGRSRRFMTINNTGHLLKKIRENWAVNQNGWLPNLMIEWTYNTSGSWTSSMAFSWDSTTAAWVPGDGGYAKYNEFNQATEYGNLIGTDSIWYNRNYYGTPAKKYQPGESGLRVAVYPNPGSDVVKVHILSEDYFKLQFSLFDAAGRRILDQPISVSAGINDLDISTPGQLKPGCYLYVMDPGSGNPPITDKFILIK